MEGNNSANIEAIIKTTVENTIASLLDNFHQYIDKDRCSSRPQGRCKRDRSRSRGKHDRSRSRGKHDRSRSGSPHRHHPHSPLHHHFHHHRHHAHQPFWFGEEDFAFRKTKCNKPGRRCPPCRPEDKNEAKGNGTKATEADLRTSLERLDFDDST